METLTIPTSTPPRGRTMYECPVKGCQEWPFTTEDEARAHVEAGNHYGLTTTSTPTPARRFETVENGWGGTTTRRVAEVVPPTPKQTAFLRSLLAERAGVPEAEDLRRMLNAHREAGTLSKTSVSKAIDALLKIDRPVAEKPEAPARPAPAWDPSKGTIAREALEAIPSGRYFVDGTFLKVDRPDNGRWAGFIFVKVIRNISGSFEDVRRVAILNPESASGRVDESHRLAVEALASDPKAAAVAFGMKTGSCCICGRTLTDPESVKAGIGPICAAKF